MRKELEDKLYEDYPKIFKQKDDHMTNTCMCWGICVGDGWYDIIDCLCERIQHHCDWVNGKNPDKDKFQVEAIQVKEKFGGLRFYTNYEDDHISGLINMAYAMADRTCEDCGMPGQLRDSGWLKTLCDECEKS